MAEAISDSVRVTARIQPEGVARREFGNTLYLDFIDTTILEREHAQLIRTIRTYPDLTALEADDHPASVEAAARIYFQQVPFPKSLLVASVLSVIQPALIFGAEAGTEAEIDALDDDITLVLDGEDVAVDLARATGSVMDVIITNGGSGYTSAPTVAFTGGGGTGAAGTAVIMGGEVVSVTITTPGSGYTSAPTITFTGGGGANAAATAVITAPVLTHDMVAARIEAGLQALAEFASATVTYDADEEAFRIQAPAPASFGAGFASNDVSNTLGLSDGALVLDNSPAETPGEALSRIIEIDCNFFGIAAAPEIAEDFMLLDSLRDWIAARRLTFMGAFDLFGPEVLVASEDTSIGARISAQAGDGIIGFYNGRTRAAIDHKALSYMGRFSSINYDRPNAVINGKFLDLPGTLPTDLTATEKAELDRKRINWYESAGRGSGADTKEGKSFGTWVDVYVWLAWFKDALEVAAYNFLKQTAGIGGIPITDQGLAAVADALEAVCERGVRNGGIAPNAVSPAMRLAIQRTTGNADFGGFLSSGYLVHRPSAADVDQALRNSRGPIPIQVFAKGSGKVNFLDIDVTLEN